MRGWPLSRDRRRIGAHAACVPSAAMRGKGPLSVVSISAGSATSAVPAIDRLDDVAADGGGDAVLGGRRAGSVPDLGATDVLGAAIGDAAIRQRERTTVRRRGVAEDCDGDAGRMSRTKSAR